eukprot:1743258-Alexandrium_andersonii.AAC.1
MRAQEVAGSAASRSGADPALRVATCTRMCKLAPAGEYNGGGTVMCHCHNHGGGGGGGGGGGDCDGDDDD